MGDYIPKTVDFLRLHELFARLVAAKLSLPKQLVDVKALSEFVGLRNRLHTTVNCWPAYRDLVRSIDAFKFPVGCAYEIVDQLEKHVQEQEIVRFANKTRHSAFVFLCCIQGHFYKDIRRLLVQHVKKANRQYIMETIDEMRQFVSRYCRK